MIDEDFDERTPHVLITEKIVPRNKKILCENTDLWEYFNIFEFYIPCDKLDGIRVPVRIIDGVTMRCELCKCIYIIDSDRHEKNCDVWRINKQSNKQS